MGHLCCEMNAIDCLASRSSFYFLMLTGFTCGHILMQLFFIEFTMFRGILPLLFHSSHLLFLFYASFLSPSDLVTSLLSQR
jgi:hypothetical protein